eukprot:m.49239 g.49239  ORF g.49239 m.49239 type:complete len:571 (-) comp10605_c0_seq1:1615-3327(-)
MSDESYEMTTMNNSGSINQAVDDDDDDTDHLNRALLPAAKTPANTSKSSMILITGIAAIGGFLFGYDTGVVSGAMLLIVEDLGLQGKLLQQEIIVSATLVGCIIAAAAARPITEKLGRKPAVLIGSFVFLIGAIMMALSRMFPYTLYVLIAGRFVVGLAVGLASMAVPLYIAELAPSSMRGVLVSLNVVFIVGGQFISCVVAATLSKFDYPHGWQLMLGLAGVPAFLQFVGMMFAPESPRWLAKYKGEEKAKAVLLSVRGSEDQAAEEVLEIMEGIKLDEELNKNAVTMMEMVTNPPLRRALTLGCMLQAIQQLTGINTVMYYSGTILVMAGFTDTTLAIWMTAAIAFVGFVFTSISMFFVEKAGRRKLTLLSLIGVIISLGMIGGGFFASSYTSVPTVPTAGCNFDTCYDCTLNKNCGYCQNTSLSQGLCIQANTSGPLNSSTECFANYEFQVCPVGKSGINYGYITFAGTALYLAAFQSGLGQTPWTINSEIFPMRARSVGVSMATSVNWIGNLVISLTFLDLCDAITVYGAFWLYATIALLGLVYFFFKLPETKGKSLEEISRLFEK